MTTQLRFLASNITNWTDEELPIVRPEDIVPRTGQIVGRDLENLLISHGGNSTTRCKQGDVLFCKLRPYLAKVVLAPVDLHASSELLVIRPRGGIAPGWLHGLLLSSSAIDWAVRTSEGAKMPRTSWESLCEFEVHDIPTWDEQIEISNSIQERFESLSEMELVLKNIEESIERVRRALVDDFFASKMK